MSGGHLHETGGYLPGCLLCERVRIGAELAALRRVAEAARAIDAARMNMTTTCATHASCRCMYCALRDALGALPKGEP